MKAMNDFYVTPNKVSRALRLRYLLLYSAVLLISVLLNAPNANASHVVGSDITYKCTSTPGVFEVTLVFYRDCNGITLSQSAGFGGCDGCNLPCSTTTSVVLGGADPSCAASVFSTVTLNLVSVRDVNINPECPDSKNICNNLGCYTGPQGTLTPGIERYEFKGLINIGPTSGIPASCCNVRISFSVNARNGTINTGSAGQNFYMDAIINRCLSVSPCNSSPTLDNDPFAVMCGGENYVFNNGAIDPDLDSLSFSFVPALQGFGSSVTYNAPWSPTTPMPWTGSAGGQFPAGIHCDPLTGDIMFTPQNASGNDFTGVMAIEVKQWKTINGVPTVIGVTRRDIQMVVLANCTPNNVPKFATEPSASTSANVPKFQWEVCAGEQLCFTIIAKDTDFLPPLISDTTYLRWNQALAPLGATFVPTYIPTDRKKPAPLGGPREDKYQFCWTPTDAMGSDNPYYFTVTAKDSRCPRPGSITRAFSIKVKPRANVSIVKNDLKCGKWQVTYTNNNANNKYPPTSTIWQISKVPGDYSMSQNPYIFTSQTTPVLNFTEGGKYLVMLQAFSPGPAGGDPCMRVFYDTIKVDTLVKPFVRDTVMCRGKTMQLSAKVKYGQPSYTYYWYNSIKDTALPALNAPVFVNSNLTVAPTATKRYTIKIRDFNGCYSFDSLKVSVKELPVGLLPDSMRLCYGNEYELDPGNNTGNMKKWLWNVGDTTRTITRNDSGIYIVTLTDTFNCEQTDTMKLFVNRQIIPDAGLDTSICSGDTLTMIGKGGQRYQWKNLATGTPLGTTSHNSIVKVSPANTVQPTKYELTVFTSYPDTLNRKKECSVTDTVIITVKALPVLTQPQPVQACRREQLVILTPLGTNQGGGTGVWSYPALPQAIVSNAQVRVDSLKNVPKSDTIFASAVWVRYTYTAPQSFGGCSSMDSAKVMIYGNPRVDAGPKLQWCTNAGEYAITTTNQKYFPSGGSTGEGEEWSGNGVSWVPAGLNKKYFFNPLHSSVQSSNIITYKFIYTYNKNQPNQIVCDNLDTVLFNVVAPPAIDAGADVIACRNDVPFNIISKQPAGSKANTTPVTGKSFWTIKETITKPAIADSQTFDPKHTAVILPPTGLTKQYTLYYNDISTGCVVKDSIRLDIARSPEAVIVYDNPVSDSPYVCITGGKQVYFRAKVTSPMTGQFSANGAPNGPNLLYGGSFYGESVAGAPTGVNSMFSSSTAAAGVYMLNMNYTENATAAGCKATASNTIEVLSQPVIAVTTPPAQCSYDKNAVIQLGQDPGTNYRFRWTTAGDGTYGNDSNWQTSYTAGAGDVNAGQVLLTATTLKRLLKPGTNGDPCPVATSTATLTIVKAPTAEILATDTEGCVPELTGTYTAGAVNVITPVMYKWEWENEPSRVEQNVASISRTIFDYDVSKKGNYRVKLTVTTTGAGKECSAMSRWANMITHATPNAEFYANPEKTTIAKPFFNFINQSTVADGSMLKYKWNLGPGPDPKKPQDRIVTETSPVNVEYSADTALKFVWLTVTSEYGCFDSIPVPIEILPDITVFIPNAFRPDDNNGKTSTAPCPDGDVECNSVFKVSANGYRTIEIFVSNRWGQQVFYTNDASKGWNGRMKQTGEMCPQEVYTYYVEATSYNDKKYKYAGTVTLLR
jgi:hypothetical protein